VNSSKRGNFIFRAQTFILKEALLFLNRFKKFNYVFFITVVYLFRSNYMLKDINEAEEGRVWPLSCYNFCPTISSRNIPGLEDISPDEMRYMQLEAQATGNIEACVSCSLGK